MRWVSRIISLSLSLSLCGCLAFARHQEDSTIDGLAVERIKKGMPKGEVTQILGSPQEIVYSNKDHNPLREFAYVYEHKMRKFTVISLALVNFGNSDEKRDRVVVFLDERGRVSHVGKTLTAHDASYGFPFGR